MTTFRLKTVDASGVGRDFFYNNQRSTLTDQRGCDVVSERPSEPRAPAAPPGRKDRVVRTLKIQLGLSCNYSCEYCSQRFVPHADQANPGDVDVFMSHLTANCYLTEDATVEFWGGEPMVYWKTLKPLAERLRMRYPGVTLRMITNGSLIDHMKAGWLISMGFTVGISHDGPGQKARGQDPLDNPLTREAILMLYQRLRPLNRISFNAMLHKESTSRLAVRDYFIKLTGDTEVPIGEGMFVDAYDEGGRSMSFHDTHEHVRYRARAFDELKSGNALNFDSVTQKIVDFGESVVTRREARTLGQKCGSDRADTLTMDLKGNVLTCQNVSAVAVAPNGQPHLAGNVQDMDAVQLKSSRHWSTREHCNSCPVLQLCKGSCMFLEGDLWDVTCESAYSDNVVFMATALYELTGCTLQRIEPLTGTLPEHRQIVFGPLANKRTTTRKIIQIKTETP
ncbi:SPASM domain-containing protein [Burkholderia sp. Bp8998]|uniref:SPASM domain-containing protein n=1 Tax=Burkholderia sp. Bp8998 TaxID=2184557 RepID=UPI000F5A3EE6|nr:SPASM domain-containing protein [Burkholderia sp. Bp8998]RQS17151.1 SPASM domain-containing protein [Burkholderia sp. Bp8998]